MSIGALASGSIAMEGVQSGDLYDRYGFHTGAAVYTPGLSERRGGASHFTHADALGTTRGLTSSSQGATDALLFDGFGLPVARSGSTPTPFGFVGGSEYQTDGDTGLLLLGHRYYDASVGRFLTADPAQAGDNWYAYCDNNPLNASDPEGLDKDGVPSPGLPPYTPPPSPPKPMPVPLPQPFPPGSTINPPTKTISVPVDGGDGGIFGAPLPPVLGGPGGPPTYTPPPLKIKNPTGGPPIIVTFPKMPIQGPVKIGPPVITVPVGKSPIQVILNDPNGGGTINIPIVKW